MGAERAVVFGSGAREACICEALIEYGWKVDNVTTDPDGIAVNVEGVVALGDFYHKPTEALCAIQAFKPGVVVVQEESLLFRGLATELRERRLHVLGADMQPSVLEQDKLVARRIVKHEFPALLPNGFFETTSAIRSGRLILPDRCVVRTRQVSGAGTTVIVTDECSKQRAVKLAESVSILVEEFVEGTQLTYYVFTDNTHIYVSPPLRTYPFRANQNQGPKTGGMGCATVSGLSDEVLARVTATVEDVADCLIRKLTADGSWLQCFSIEVIVGDNRLAYIESDVRLGDPEVCLLRQLLEPKQFAELLLALATGCLTKPRETRLKGLSVVLAPVGYPDTLKKAIVSADWTRALRQKGGTLHLGKIEQVENGKTRLSSSRAGVYTRTGNCFAAVCDATYADLQAAHIPIGLDYRTDIGS